MRWWNRTRSVKMVELDEILLDASNLPSFNTGRLEGRRELPIAVRNIYTIGIIFSLISCVFFYHVFRLQIVEGSHFREISDNNTVNRSVIIAERGVVFDRNGELVIWNEPDYTGQYGFPVRAYTDRLGMGQLIGYVSYPQKDKKGFYFRTEYVGRTGVESAFEDFLHGQNGEKIIEEDARGDVVGEHAVKPATPGGELHLSVDASLSEAMYQIIATSSAQAGFRSGAGAIMDVHTGEIIAMTSFPSFDPEVMADGDDTTLISTYNKDDRFPFLNKVMGGVYTPGSIVKPFVAYAALKEGVISENTHIYSNGMLKIPNPYTPTQPTYFADWRSQGDMTVKEALAYSSDVFFYIVGGGLPAIAAPQAGLSSAFTGLGIKRMDEYFDFFQFGHKTGIKLANEQIGVVPTPEWKESVFREPWLLGNSYHTSIGQFGWQTTPLQMLVAYGALANSGRFFIPKITKDEKPEYVDKTLDPAILSIVKEGMRMTITSPRGTAQPLRRSDIEIAAKSGTAELGVDKAHVNSWVAGFWPYEKPQYAFILMMDHAPRSNSLGATKIMGEVFDWMATHRPEYMGLSTSTTVTTTP